MKFADKIDRITESIFSLMSELSIQHNAVNLGQGFPEFDGPKWIMKEAFRAMTSGKNQYAPMIGIQSLREQLSSLSKEKYDIYWDKQDEITNTAGATEGLFSTFHAILNPGDEVILFEPYYDSYEADILLTGAKPVYVTLHKPNFNFIVDELASSINNKTKAIVLNNPNNPTGKIFSIEELKIIADLAVKMMY